MSNYSDASIVHFPSGRKTSKAYSQKPTDGTADLTFARNTACDEIDSAGASTEVVANMPRYDFRKEYVIPTDGSYYSFDGTNDYIPLANPTVSPVSNAYSVILKFTTGADVTTEQVIYNNTFDSNNRLAIGVEAGYFCFSTYAGSYNSDNYPIVANTEYVFAITKDNTASTKTVYLNGVAVATTGTIHLPIASSIGHRVGADSDGTNYFGGYVYTCETYNLELSASEVLDRYNGVAITDAYKQANNVDFTAGAFTVGKSYRIATAGTTDFTLIGSADSVVGTEFTATAVGTGTGTATSIGNTLNLSTGKTAATWYDLDHDAINTVTGATLTDTNGFSTNAHTLNTCASLLLELAFITYFKTSRVPITQTVVGLSVGTTYTINCKGTGIITIDETGGVGIGGTATEVNPFTYVATATSVVVTLVSGEAFDWVQMTNTAYPMNHVETLTSTISKVVDTASKGSLSSYINSETGVLLFKAKALVNNLVSRRISLSDGTNTNRLFLAYGSTSNSIRLFVTVAGANVVDQINTITDITASNTIAVRWALNDYSVWVNGSQLGSTDVSATVFTANILTTLGLNGATGGSNFEGGLEKLQVYNSYKTDAEMITLTT